MIPSHIQHNCPYSHKYAQLLPSSKKLLFEQMKTITENHNGSECRGPQTLGWPGTNGCCYSKTALSETKRTGQKRKDCKSQKSRKSVAGSCLHLWKLNNTTALENLNNNTKRNANMEGGNYLGPHP